ncbi:putative rapid ALkalinization Factor [Medicago truncatula]|uniref:Putative rapid ALkalinization Factor n=1 Tax=Medicago truncatula TaxID=3880 RepID=G7KMZ0_MEDTR|nr:RALF [Medicago truncatula]RHN52090.1 putative rapid ALkalinization Factor [Medicago truncatula]
MINFKPWLMFFFLAMVIAMVSAKASKVHDFSFPSPVLVGDLIREENEMLMDSESNRRRYISYDALLADSIPCGLKGQSYYDCNHRDQVNPYRRGCTAITHCARVL